mmetsp:Transcript_19812/g.39478  ORF Transcript_19812/g.39478 Transcript_19812/m.39478 type:complete len:297 (-) Transcript_19812:118-1008(-)|eukprot:CAMPEP_0194338748 /NCGR_PEP_ID=MMETSP0171-20130528/80673_1 /TAXON_ID=218684 /ORGANISM="Corethron pennatum, Strain L29A3" /LENGTH=296 /DNA_ID=CAMNT_0039102999 /DNA_START=161 /DNA_END=1051 /DNA_ORIENTATION=+
MLPSRKDGVDDEGGPAKTLEDAVKNFTNESAFMIVYERALETDRGEDALILDPFAKRLAAVTKGKELSEHFGKNACEHFGFKGWPDFHRQWTAVRTRFIDDAIRRTVSPPDGLQFVNLGAGFDMRSYRLACLSPAAAAYEVDMEAMNRSKESVFEALLVDKGGAATEPVCPRRVVSADFTVENDLTNSLKGAGYDAAGRGLFLAEGLIMYLGEAQRSFLQEVSRLAAPGSVLILNFLDGPSNTSNLSTDQLKELLLAEGWTDLTFNKFGDNVLNYGRFNSEYNPTSSFSFVTCTRN